MSSLINIRSKGGCVPVSPILFAFAGTLDLHHHQASTAWITPTLIPAKFISEIGVLPLGTPPCHSAKSSTAGTEHRVSLNLMSTDRQPRNQCYSRRLTPDPSSSRFFSHQSTRYPPAITLLICFSVWSGKRDLDSQHPAWRAGTLPLSYSHKHFH